MNGKSVGYYYFNSNVTSGLVLDDGASAAFSLDSSSCSNPFTQGKVRCGFMVIDVNGAKQRPNTWGKDLFLFFIYQNQIMPADAKSTDNSCYGSNDAECSGYKDDCETGTNYGLTCASKYLFK